MNVENKQRPKQPRFQSLWLECEQDMLRRVKDDEPSLAHLNSGGSRTRARTCIAMGQELSLPKSDIICLSVIVELLHNASLIHDDVQDEDSHRRGRESLWRRFGKARAICSGDAMISAAYGATADLSSSAKIPEIIREIHRAVAETIEGQAMDLAATNEVDETHYETTAAKKSGPLFRLSLSLPLILANRTDLLPKVEYIAAVFAIAYQINDDLDDYEADAVNGDLNLVNVLSTKRSLNDALFIARDRAKYLLRKCQQQLSVLPDESSQIVLVMINKLRAQLESH